MKKQIIGIVAALGISLASVAPANAWYGGWGYGGWGGYGYGGWGYGGGYGAAMLGAGLVGGIIGGALAAPAYGYGYGYAAPVYGAPVYAAPAAPRVKKNIIIKNSPGATVIEEDDIFGGW